MLAILLAIKKWKFLLEYEFIIKIDHKPLKFLLEQRLETEALHLASKATQLQVQGGI